MSAPAPEALRDAKILVVDDEPVNVRLLERILGDAGCRALSSTTDAREVLDLYRRVQPDLIVLDLMMPHLDGVAVLAQLRAEIPPAAYVPVLVLTADATPDAKRRALAAGAHDFLTKPFEHFEALLRIGNLLATRRLYLALEAHARALEDTVRERTERLLQSEKVAAMGSLLAGVAHELNNPLTVLSAQAQLLDATDPGSFPVRTAKIRQAADRCVRIVRNFLAFARQRPPERSPALLRDIVQNSVELLAYELRVDGVEVALELGADLPVMWVDPHQLHQVFVNLIVNAQHAMRRRPGPRRVSVRSHYDAGRGVVHLEFEDTGPGIPDDVRARIFEPFFTTKPPGEGTGLGLSLCRGIIEEHRGTITVASAAGRGTTFIVELPVETPPRTEPPAAAAAPAAVRCGTVLVVDDERAVAEALADAIRRDGHEVDIAGDGAEALGLLATHRYDLVVSDTKMPVLDGESFYRELSRRHPALRGRLVFLTGDVLSRDKREFLEQTGAPYLAKPCDLDELRRVIARVLAAPPTA
ncbi:MAG TPA: response regulator [Methylomirabilota bacterium]|jgi:two-component system NtrC family sensor kinase|nr:response regulator [Methylomirabilota bacterium]